MIPPTSPRPQTELDPVRYPWVAVGNSALRVPRLGVGTVPLGDMVGPIGEEEAHAIIRRAHAAGARLFDTAPQYGIGLAERRLRRVLPHLPRDQFVIATKVGRLLRPVSSVRKLMSTISDAVARGRGGVPRFARNAIRGGKRVLRRPTTARLGWPLERGDAALDAIFDFSYDGTMRSIEESLERLGLDRVDLVLIHDPDDHLDEALAGSYRALARLRDEGLVSAIGVGSNAVGPLMRMATEADLDCLLVAGRYTMLDHRAAPGLLPLCQERGISVIIGGVYNSGMLVAPRPGQLFDYQQQSASSDWLRRALELQAICAGYGVPLAAAAIQFPLGHPSVACVLTGVSSVHELEQNVEMFTWPIPADLWVELRSRSLLPPHAPTAG